MMRIPRPGRKLIRGTGSAMEIEKMNEKRPMIRSQACTLM